VDIGNGIITASHDENAIRFIIQHCIQTAQQINDGAAAFARVDDLVLRQALLKFGDEAAAITAPCQAVAKKSNLHPVTPLSRKNTTIASAMCCAPSSVRWMPSKL